VTGLLGDVNWDDDDEDDGIIGPGFNLVFFARIVNLCIDINYCYNESPSDYFRMNEWMIRMFQSIFLSYFILHPIFNSNVKIQHDR